MTAEILCKRYDGLKAARATFESHWQEIAENIFPRRADFNVQRATGDKRTQKIIDSTGTQGLELLAAGLHGMASNPAARWFSLKTDDDKLNEDDTIREWLSQVEDIIFSRLHSPRSSITTHLHELYLDYAGFGTGVMFVGVSKSDDLLFQTRFLGECVIDENAEGMVDTVIRCFKMTVRQMIQRWGKDKVSSDTSKKYDDGKLDDHVDILHAVFPREDRDPLKVTADNMPWASIYLEKKAKHELQNGGFEEFPYAVPRWYKVAGEIYGRSPAMTALPDVKMLQEMAKTTIKAAQKIVDPPLLVPDDGMLGPVRTVPGGLNFFRGERQITPLVTNANIPISLEMMQDLRNRILTTFFADQLQMVGNADMTATEVMQRTEERMRLLGPILGRMESELLGPIISRVFGILARQGALPDQPQELDGREFRIEYVSPIALAQRGQKVERAVQMLTIAGQMAAFDPNVMARFDGDNFLPWIASELGVDPELVLDDKEYEAKQQAVSMASMAQPAQMAADAFAKAGQGAKSFAEAGAVGNA